MLDCRSDTAEIRRSFDEARAAWPPIDVPFEAFAARAIRGRRAHVADLYLACALSSADPAALAAFDRQFLGEVPGAVARIDRSADFIAEVQQILRERLLVGPRAKIRDYRGGGALAGWVRIAAVRTALNLRRRARREVAHAAPFDLIDASHELTHRPDLDPALALLRARHKPSSRRRCAARSPRWRPAIACCCSSTTAMV